MATKSTQTRNLQTTAVTKLYNRLDLRTAGGSTTLATFTIAFGIPSTGVGSVTGVPLSTTGAADGTAAEARLYRTAVAGSGYLVNGTPSIGDVSIPVDTGTGALAVGDLITFNGHAQEYMITKAYAGGAGNIDIFPGLMAAPADNAAISAATVPDVTGLTVGTSGTNVIVSNTSIATGQDVQLDSCTWTTPAATA